MNPIDIAVIVILVLGFIWGFSKGFVYMIFTLIAIAAGLIAAFKLSPFISAHIFPAKYIQTGNIVIFIIIFILVYFIIRKLSYLFEDMIGFLELEWLDSLLGGVIGLVQFFIIAGLLLTLLYSSGIIKIIPNSGDVKIAQFMMDTSQKLAGYIKGNIGQITGQLNIKPPGS